MGFIVPDTFLENYICSVCYKYLSVIPVKICSNGKKVCGRCVKNQSDETDSKYNLLAVGALFKCVNQYDGCRSILPVNQVEVHEKTCKSKVHICPLCPKAVNLETYLFMQHFRSYHEKNILQNCYFELDASLYQNETYFFKSTNYLFLVTVQMKSDALFTISVLRDGNLIEDIYQRFRIICGDSVIETRKKLVSPVTKSEGNSFIISRSDFVNGKLHVLFELEFRGLTKVIEDSLDGLSKLINKNSSAFRIGRKISYKEQISNKSEVTISGKRFIPFCFACSEIISCIDGIIYYIIEKDTNIYVCLHCLIYIELIKMLKYCTDSEDRFTTTCTRILFYCQWGCGTTCYNNELLDHELTCIYQPARKCPFDDCDFIGKINDIEKHFNSTHKTDKNKIYIHSSIVRILPNVEIYVWLQGYFVIIKFTFGKDFLNLKIDYEGLPKQMTLVIMFENGCGYYISGPNGSSLKLNLRDNNYDLLKDYAKIIIREETDSLM